MHVCPVFIQPSTKKCTNEIKKKLQCFYFVKKKKEKKHQFLGNLWVETVVRYIKRIEKKQHSL